MVNWTLSGRIDSTVGLHKFRPFASLIREAAADIFFSFLDGLP